jgi:DNA topoisomerase-1
MAKANANPPEVKRESSQLDPGVSIRFGPVQDKDVEMKDAEGGASKRKGRTSVSHRKSYAESESSDEDDQPLVRHTLSQNSPRLPLRHIRGFVGSSD